MANKYGIDMGSILGNVEAIKGSRIKNQSGQIDLDEKRLMIEQRPAKQAAEQKRQNVLTGLRQSAAGGSQADAQQLISLDPKNGPKFMEAVYNADKNQLEAMKRNVDEMGTISAFVMEGKTPEEQASRYSRARQSLSTEVQASMPEQFDPNFVSLSLARAIPMEKILENPKAVNFGSEDILYKSGQELERTASQNSLNAKSKALGGGGKSFKISSADESLMDRKVVGLLGGIMDQDGNITVLDPEKANLVVSISTEAANIFAKENGRITRGEAVKLAANKFDIRVGDAPDNLSNLPGFLQDSLRGPQNAPAPEPATPTPAPAQTQAAPQYQEGTVIRNPSTGESLRMVNGQWVPVNS
jgi:hypothetical protein